MIDVENVAMTTKDYLFANVCSDSTRHYNAQKAQFIIIHLLITACNDSISVGTKPRLHYTFSVIQVNKSCLESKNCGTEAV